MPNKLVVVGRDGVLNRFRDEHVSLPEEWEALPGALEAVARLNHAGWHVVVATNQPGLGRGLLDMTSLNAVHLEMNRQLAKHGARVDAVFLCPHTPEDQCDCRKPAPGLLLKIGERFGVDLAHVPSVGDTTRDLEAARAAGCEGHLLRSGRAAALSDEDFAAVLAAFPEALVHDDLAAFAEFLIHREHGEGGEGADSGPGPLHA